MLLNIGDKAPNFSLPDSENKLVSLSGFKYFVLRGFIQFILLFLFANKLVLFMKCIN